MGLLKEVKARMEADKQNEIAREISKMKIKKKRDLTPEEERKIVKRIENSRLKRFNKRVKFTIAAIITSIGVAIGGHALLTSGDKAPKEDKTAIENTENTTKTTESTEKQKTAREEFIEGLQSYDTEINTAKTEEENDIVEEIFETYNANLADNQKIDKDDLGIILQNNFNEDSHVIKNISEDGEITYEENDKKSDLLLEEGDERLSRNDIGAIYVLVDKQNMNTVAGVGKMDGGYHELNAESIMRAEYSKNDATYVGLPEGADEKEAFEDFSEYYKERLNNIEKDEQEELEQDNELEY